MHSQAVEPLEEGQDTEQAQRLDSDDERNKNRELFSAIHKGDVGELVEVLYLGVKVNIIDRNNKKNTPLHYAIEKGNKEIVEKLLHQEGININAQNIEGDTPLCIATRKGNKELVDLLNNSKHPSTSNGEEIADILEKNEQQIQQKRCRLTKPTAPVSTGVTTPPDEISQSKETDQSHSKSACGLHGNIYQLKLLMLFFKRGVAAKYSFRLATEWDAAEKFDDLVFQFTDSNNKEVYRFLQAKHKQDAFKQISESDLLSEKNEDFSLQKYFISYRKIKQKPKFNKYELQNFVICTNIGLDADLQKSFENVEGEDKILDMKGPNKRLKFKIDFPIKTTLTSIFQKTSELKKLAKMLADHVSSDKDLMDKYFNKYHVALARKVINIDTKKFKSDFISNSPTLSDEAKKFRKALLDELRPNKFLTKKFLTKKLKISDNKFGNVIEVETNPSIKEVTQFAKRIVALLPRKITKETIIIPSNEDISDLVGHVFVETENETIKFRWGFIKSKVLPGNLKDFREALKTELSARKPVIQFTQLDQFKFNYATHICTEEDYEKRMNNEDPYVLPNDDEQMISKEMNEFLEKLVLAVNQPNEYELGKIIEAEMGEGINLFDGKFAVNNFQEYMLDWMKAKQGCFLTHIDGKNFFKEAKQQISKLVVIGPTEDYHAKVAAIGVLYSEDPTELRSFLNSNDKQIFNLIISDTMLGSIKVHQTIKRMPKKKYQKDDSHIFMCLSSVLRIKHRVISTFESRTTNNLLAIACDPVEEDTKKLYDDLCKIIGSNENKKIVLITQINNGFAKKFEDNLPDKYEEKKDENNSFIDLTIKSRKKLSNERKVIFQGDEVNLGTLMDGSEDLIDAEILSKLVNNEKIAIGKKPAHSKFDDVKDYYIDRPFNRHIININKGFKKEKSKFFIINKDNFTELNPQQDQDLVLISDSPDDFKELCNKYKKPNIHRFTEEIKKEQEEFTWQQSRGVLSKLRDFVDTKEQSIQEFKPNEVTDRLVIIAAKPGMGKSTLLSHLKSDSSLWVVRINLVDQSNQLSKWEKNSTKISESEIAKFLYGAMDFQIFRENEELIAEEEKDKMIIDILELVENNKEQKWITGLNRLELKLFYNFFKNGKIALKFDGFDEICSDYNSQVIELLEFLKGTKTEKIWITTRPYNILFELEDKLGTFSYALKPLLEEEQKSFLKKFWKKKLKLSELDEQRSKIFIDELLHQFSKSINDPERTFVGIPLQIYMIAEVFSEDFKEFYYSEKQTLSVEDKHALSEKLNLVTPYKGFFDTKLREELKKVHLIFKKTQPYSEKYFAVLRQKFLEDHKKLAVYALFEKDKLRKVLSEQEINEVHALVDNINKGEEKTGVIDGIINGKPNFIHRTFAEYLAAKYFWDKFKSIESNKFEKDFVEAIIINILIDDDMIQICKFFQLETQKDLEANVDFSNKESKLETLFIKLVSRTHVYGPDKEKNSKQSTKLLLKIIECSLLEKNDQKIIENVKGLEMCKKVALLSVSAEMGYIKLAKYLTFVTNDLEDYLNCNKWIFSPLWLAVKNDHSNIIKLLLDMRADPNIPNKWVGIPRHLTAEKGHLDSIKLLLDIKADPNIENKLETTPLQLAEEEVNQNPQIYQEIIDIFKSKQQENRPINQVVAKEYLPSTSHKSSKK